MEVATSDSKQYIADNKNLEKLQKIIDNLDSDHHLQIAEILYKNKVKLTQNNNGIFVNLNGLSQEIIENLWNYI